MTRLSHDGRKPLRRERSSARSGWPYRVLVLATLMAAALACSVPSSPDPAEPPPGEPPGGSATAILELTNAERARAGLPPFNASPSLTRAAQLQAEQVAAAGRLEHLLPEAPYPRIEDRLNAAGYPYQAAAENLASGQRTPSLAVTAWMLSPGHRDNILSSLFSDIGTAYIVGSNGQQYYVQVFGRPR